MFVLSSDITIGNFRFTGAQNVTIKRSIHSITDIAVIKIPSIGKLVTNHNVLPDTVITGKQFADGDAVTIKLGYNGALETEFAGFVKRRNLNMPLEIECEGYSWLLRRNNINVFERSISVKDLLLKAVSEIQEGYTIDVECTVDITLENVWLPNTSGFGIINSISQYTDGCLICFFTRPDTLWCGLVYTPCANGDNVLNADTVNYRLGYNVINGNSLKERVANNDPVKVTYSSRLSAGQKISQDSDVFSDFARVHSKILTSVKSDTALKQLADEKAYRSNYVGYEGSVNGFLQPYALPGYKAHIADDRYPERNGTYIIEGIEVRFGIHGARRIVEIGPQLGAAK